MNVLVKNITRPRVLLGIMLGGCTLWGAMSGVESPLEAHQTEVQGNLAITWHVEPDDRPVAGKPAQVRLILTRAGGVIVPLADCDCTLKIWTVPPQPQPLITPPLRSIDAEQKTGIPAADVIFPARGEYDLELKGSPKGEADFIPFDFKHRILVPTGTAPSGGSALSASPKSSAPKSSNPVSSNPVSSNPLSPPPPPDPLSSPVGSHGSGNPGEESPISWVLLGGALLVPLGGVLGVWAWKTRKPPQE
jgi:hypothetical protein